MLSSEDCRFEIIECVDQDGGKLVRGECVPCGYPVWSASPDDAQVRFEHHRGIPAPPAEVLARPVTAALVDEFPAWFLNGRGYRAASVARCGHGEPVTDCVNC